MTKIKIITAKGNNPTERALAIEKVQNTNENIICKGSIYYEYQNELYADIYLVQGQTKILPNRQVGDKMLSPLHKSPKASNSKEKFITPESWKSKEPTLKQRNALKKMGLTWDKINQMSMYDASIKIGGK